MENAYVKQYPDLMAGKKIMYVHGFMSSGQSGTVKLLRELMPEATVVARDIPLHPDEGFAMLGQMAREEQPDLIIGTSMGGMYAERLRGFDRILVNPALRMGDTMSRLTGKQAFQNPREDGVQEFMVTKGLIKEYRDFSDHCFEGLSTDDADRVWGLFGDTDDVVDSFGLFAQHYRQAIHFHGGHRLIDKVAHHYLVPVIRWIDDRQAHRERPVVYLAFEALHDEYGHAVSSMHKVYEQLLEDYQVYVVAPAPTNDPGFGAKVTAWVEEYLSAPAWNHIIMTNRKALLYGDYFVDPHPDENFMGTNIAIGSDEFKTFEEVATYFGRLKPAG